MRKSFKSVVITGSLGFSPLGRMMHKSARSGWRSESLCAKLHVIDRRMRFGNRLAYFSHRFEVRGQCVLKVASRFFRGIADGNASGNIGGIGGIAGPGLLNDYCITSHVHFRLAFLSIAFSVPVANSFPGLPGTVITRAAFGCLKWRWLPFECISTHPFFSNKRITSRTLSAALRGASLSRPH